MTTLRTLAAQLLIDTDNETVGTAWATEYDVVLETLIADSTMRAEYAVASAIDTFIEIVELCATDDDDYTALRADIALYTNNK